MAMTWVPARRRWTKKYKGRMYVVSPRALGVEATKEASLQAANSWWQAKQAEIDAEAVAAKAPTDRLVSSLATLVAIEEYQRTGRVPAKLLVDLGDGVPVTVPLRDVQSEGESRASRIIAAIDSEFSTAPLEDTIGGRAEEWLRVIHGRVSAGKTDVSRYGAYKRNLDTFLDWISRSTRVDGVTSRTLESWYNELAGRVALGKYSTDYAWSIFGATKRFVKWLSGHGLIALPGNFDSSDFRFGQGKRVHRDDLFTPSEVVTLLEKANSRLRLFLLLMLNCGMYQSDISDLGEDEVDWEKGIIRRHRSKNNARVVGYKLWPETWELLRAHRNRGTPVLNESGKGRVLVTGDGMPLTNYWIEDGKERRYDTVQGQYARLKAVTGVSKPMKNLRKTSANHLASHPEHRFFTEHFLAHAPRSVVGEFYLAEPRDEDFWPALAWLGRQYGLGT